MEKEYISSPNQSVAGISVRRVISRTRNANMTGDVSSEISRQSFSQSLSHYASRTKNDYSFFISEG